MKEIKSIGLFGYWIGKYSRRFRIWYRGNCPGKSTWGLLQYIKDISYLDECGHKRDIKN